MACLAVRSANQADPAPQIDDAIEVKQISKTNNTETRRPLGVCLHRSSTGHGTIADWGCSKSCSRATTCLSSRACPGEGGTASTTYGHYEMGYQGKREIQAHGKTGVGSVCFIVGKRSKRALDLAVPEDEAVQRLI